MSLLLVSLTLDFHTLLFQGVTIFRPIFSAAGLFTVCLRKLLRFSVIPWRSALQTQQVRLERWCHFLGEMIGQRAVLLYPVISNIACKLPGLPHVSVEVVLDENRRSTATSRCNLKIPRWPLQLHSTAIWSFGFFFFFVCFSEHLGAVTSCLYHIFTSPLPPSLFIRKGGLIGYRIRWNFQSDLTDFLLEVGKTDVDSRDEIWAIRLPCKVKYLRVAV